MCNCYWIKCAICKKNLIHIYVADFCMPRDDIRFYCQRHIPKKDIVIHELIENEYYRGIQIFPKPKVSRKRTVSRLAGWKMTTRYLKKPPKDRTYPIRIKDLNKHFKDSTTMTYAIQRGKIIYQKDNFLERYFKWSLVTK